MAGEHHLLIVDDDPDICQLVSQFLEAHGYRVTTAGDGIAMKTALASQPVDLIILDLMLPGEDGLSLCRTIRTTARTPIIFLTAVDNETDRVVGLELGADDYLTKPFSTRELLARIRAILRRAEPDPAGPTLVAGAGRMLRFSGWALDTGRRRLTAPDGVLVELTGGEYELLLAFLERPQLVLSREQLLDATRGRAAGPYDRTVDVQVGRLRRKIETDPKAPTLIQTVRGGGYVLAAPVTTEERI